MLSGFFASANLHEGLGGNPSRGRIFQQRRDEKALWVESLTSSDADVNLKPRSLRLAFESRIYTAPVVLREGGGERCINVLQRRRWHQAYHSVKRGSAVKDFDCTLKRQDSRCRSRNRTRLVDHYRAIDFLLFLFYYPKTNPASSYDD